MLEFILQSAQLSAEAVRLQPLVLLLAVGAFTPGPNNLLLLISGNRVGLRRTLPHILGITVGFAALLVFQGVVFSQVFRALPWSYFVLRLLFTAFLLWLAWKIATADTAIDSEATEKASPFPVPFGFTRACLFQFINPKAWSVAAVVVANYTSGDPARLGAESLLIAIISVPITIAATVSWTAFGKGLRAFLSSPCRARRFHLAMAFGLVLAIAGAWF